MHIFPYGFQQDLSFCEQQTSMLRHGRYTALALETAWFSIQFRPHLLYSILPNMILSNKQSTLRQVCFNRVGLILNVLNFCYE